MWITTTIALAGPAGPGIVLKQVSAPPQVVTGVTSIDVVGITGFGADVVANEILAAAGDHDRVRLSRGAAVAGALVDAGTDLASAYVEQAVGGGLQGKLAAGLTGAVAGALENELETEKFVLDDGLRIDVFTVAKGAGDARLVGSTERAESVRDFKAKVAKTDGNGNVVKDSDGKTGMVEISCKERKVNLTLAWTLQGAAGPLARGSVVRSAVDQKCGPDIGSLASAEALAQKALPGMGGEVADDLMPAWSIVRVPLKRDKEIDTEVDLAKQHQLMPAICGMRGMNAATEYQSDWLYDEGAMHEALGFHGEATALYQRALAADATHKLAAKGLERVSARAREVESLVRAYGMTWKIGSADYGTCPPLPTGRRVTMKKDAPLSDADGATIATLPRGMLVWVQEEGATLKVVTRDGRTGYVDAKAVK